MRRIPRPSPATVIATIALIVAIGGTAYATGEGNPILGGVRNPGNDTTRALTRETGIIASTSTYGTRQSNKSSNGGGAIYGCRSGAGGTAARNEPCIRSNNLSSGLAFELVTSGAQAGLITTGSTGGVPFTTNATGVATGLNADRVDSLDAEQIVTNARVGLSPLKAMTFVSASNSNPDEAAGRAAATEVPIATFGPFTIYGKCYVETTAGTVRAETILRTSQDGALADLGGVLFDGSPGYLNTGTAEVDRVIDATTATANVATVDMDNTPGTLVAVDGTAFDLRAVNGAKRDTLAAGNGPWGGGDRCAFGLNRFGAS